MEVSISHHGPSHRPPELCAVVTDEHDRPVYLDLIGARSKRSAAHLACCFHTNRPHRRFFPLKSSLNAMTNARTHPTHVRPDLPTRHRGLACMPPRGRWITPATGGAGSDVGPWRLLLLDPPYCRSSGRRLDRLAARRPWRGRCRCGSRRGFSRRARRRNSLLWGSTLPPSGLKLLDERTKLAMMLDYEFGRGTSRVLPADGLKFFYSRRSDRLKQVARRWEAVRHHPAQRCGRPVPLLRFDPDRLQGVPSELCHRHGRCCPVREAGKICLL